MSDYTFTVYKGDRRGWYRIFVFNPTKGLTTYRIKGKGEVKKKIEALKKYL